MTSEPTVGRAGRRPTRRAALVAAAGVIVTVMAFMAASLVGSPSSPTAAPMPPVTEPTTTTTTVARPVSPVPVITTIAEVTGALPYAASPGGPTAGALPVGSWWGETKHLPVIARVSGWLEVRLPQRPNGSTGWIPESSAVLSTTSYAVLVDVTNRRLKLYQAGQVVVDAPAGVGTPDDPTPLGQFYLMVVEGPRGPGYGPFIMGTNAHSEAIQSWEGSGDAFTAIHGPLGADAAIGTTGAAISHGCIRLHVADLEQLSPAPVGTPVVIVA
jgi:lipoprotein-anchoring transpeptidase ErfK/SrfK